MEVIRRYYEKKRRELWCKALGKRSFDLCQQGDSDFTPVSDLLKGKYNLAKVPRLAVECVSVESIGNCF